MTPDAQGLRAAAPSACPDAATLERLFSGLVPEDEAAALEQHVLECSRCCATARALSAGDTLADALQAHTAADSLAGESRVQDLIARLQTLRPAEPPAIEETQVTATEPTDADAWGLRDVLEPPQSADELGRFGPYRVLRVLGSGGMGLVLEAEEAKLKRRVALKIMKPSLAKQELPRQRFLREAQATAAIEHPHIVTIFQVGEVGETPFLAMQLLKGESLDSRLRRLASGGRREGTGNREQGTEASPPQADQPPVDSAGPAAPGIANCKLQIGRRRTTANRSSVRFRIAADWPRDRRGPGRGARAGPDPPRREAFEHLARSAARLGQTGRFRPGARRRRRPPHAVGHDPGHARLHVARASAWRRRRRPRRPVQPGLRALQALDGQRPLPGHFDVGRAHGLGR